ncbi:MAG: hypothetical protein IJN77_07950 [Oscillospiraceae bacterium]|nr:hypothetical protein [Oscillospiraceae bacterium]
MLDKNNVKSYLLIIIMAFVLYNPQLLIQSVKNGMLVCYNSVIPSLYIFMVFANYRAKPEIMELLSIPFRWYGRLMKVKDNYFSGCLAVSLLGGFAVGANYINEMKRRGYSEKALSVLSVAMINNSFSYCVFATGFSAYGNVVPGLILYVSLTAASMITAFVFSFLYEYNIVSSCYNYQTSDINIVSAIKKSVDTILVICGFVIFFNVICEVISLYTSGNILINIFSAVFMEVTCGTLKILNYFKNNIYLLCFSLSVFPVCTLCQVYHFTGNSDIIRKLLLSRIIHTPISVLILSILINLFPTVLHVNSNITPKFVLYSQTPELSSVMFLITAVFIIISDKNKLFTKYE